MEKLKKLGGFFLTVIIAFLVIHFVINKDQRITSKLFETKEKTNIETIQKVSKGTTTDVQNKATQKQEEQQLLIPGIEKISLNWWPPFLVVIVYVWTLILVEIIISLRAELTYANGNGNSLFGTMLGLILFGAVGVTIPILSLPSNFYYSSFLFSLGPTAGFLLFAFILILGSPEVFFYGIFFGVLNVIIYASCSHLSPQVFLWTVLAAILYPCTRRIWKGFKVWKYVRERAKVDDKVMYGIKSYPHEHTLLYFIDRKFFNF